MKLSARSTRVSLLLILTVVAVLVTSCTAETTPPTNRTIPHQGDWGIYALDLSSEEVELIWSCNETISHLGLNRAGDEFAFSRKIGGTLDSNEEVFTLGVDGTGLRQLTSNSYRDLYPCYSQGLAIWSHSGDKLVYVVAAIGSAGKYDIYMMDSDGSNARSIIPDYFPASFLCHSAMFSKDDSEVYFTGQWWT